MGRGLRRFSWKEIHRIFCIQSLNAKFFYIYPTAPKIISPTRNDGAICVVDNDAASS